MPLEDYKPTMGDTTSSKRPLDPSRCKAGVHYYIGNWPHYKQCENKAKPDGYCGTHNPEKVKARDAATDARQKAKFDKDMGDRKYGYSGRKLAAALAKIRDGDNDPRTTAREVLEAIHWEGGHAQD